MGCRKDDVTRTPKPHRNRPLSAVIEEFETDDPDSRCNIIININNNNNVGDGDNNYVVDSGHTEGPAPLSNIPESPKGSRWNESSASETSCSSPGSVPTSPAPTPSVNVSLEPGSGDSTGSGCDVSPKTSRKAMLRSGRRQALIPNLSPKLVRRSNTSFALRLTPPQNDVTDSDDDTMTPSDMARLKQTADRLHLSTRRPSVMQWRAQYIECPQFPVQLNSGNSDVTELKGGEGGSWTAERTERINTALDWIKNELLEMRAQDQLLARQLLTIRSDIHQLKLARSCEEHQDMLDDVQSELEDLQEFADVLDLPTHTFTDSPLKHLGVTRMNFSARRFSTC